MVQTDLSPGSRIPVWLLPAAVLVVSAALAALPQLPFAARLSIPLCGVVAAGLLGWSEWRRVRAVQVSRGRFAAEREVVRQQVAVQEAETIRLANELLPAAVHRLRSGALAEEALAGLTPGYGLSRELGAAHRAVLSSVISAVEAQESLQDSSQRAFVNIARRVQAIVHQQAQDLREMQDKHGRNQDFFADLLLLDHGNALVGRLADSVAVLAGARSGRQWRQDVPLFNVLRGAMSRIKDYERIDLHSVAEFAVTGPAVEPLIHALAELLDNATRYSPPQTRVHLTATEVQAGIAVEIEDAGVGLTEEGRARAEAALAHAGSGLDLDDLGETPRLGLAVVGRLAFANDFTVGLRPSTYGGVRAVLTVPSSQITITPTPGGQIARAATLPPPRQQPRGLDATEQVLLTPGGGAANAGTEPAGAPAAPETLAAPVTADNGDTGNSGNTENAGAPATTGNDLFFGNGADGAGQAGERIGQRSGEPLPPPPAATEFATGPSGLPQRQRRRGAPAPAAPPTEPVSTPAGAAVQPGMWLAAFQDGVSGKTSATQRESRTSEQSSVKDG